MLSRDGREGALCCVERARRPAHTSYRLNLGSYGYELWLPSIIKSFSGRSDAVVGRINAVSYLIAAIVTLLVGRRSDRTGERKGHEAAAATASAVGFAVSAYFTNLYLALGSLALAFAGSKSTIGPFWALDVPGKRPAGDGHPDADAADRAEPAVLSPLRRGRAYNRGFQ